MDLLEDFKMTLLKFEFVMIYIIHKMLVLVKNYPKHFKDNMFERQYCFLVLLEKSNKVLLFFEKIKI